MAGNLPDAIENMVLDDLVGTAARTAPTTPIMCRLMTANGDDDSDGTEVDGGSYEPQPVTFTEASGGSCASEADLEFTGMPACTVTGIELWDSAGTPVRIWYGSLGSSRTVEADDTFVIPAGSLTLSLD